MARILTIFFAVYQIAFSVWPAPANAGPTQAVAESVFHLRNKDFQGARTVLLEGYHKENDGGGGELKLQVGNSLARDNGCTIFKDLAGNQYIRRDILVPLPLTHCGVTGDGQTNDQQAMRRALGLSVPVIGTPNTRIRLPENAGISYDISKVELDCKGATLDFSDMSTGTAITLTTTSQRSQSQAGLHDLHPLHHCNIVGPDARKNVVGVRFLPISVNKIPYIVGTNFHHFSAIGFSTLFLLSEGTAFTSWSDCHYSNETNTSSGSFITLDGNQRNAGEKYTISNCRVIDTEDFIVDRGGAPNADIYATNVSVDGTKRMFVGDNGNGPGSAGARSRLFFSGHVELPRGDGYFIDVDRDGAFIFTHGELLVPSSTIRTLCRSNGNPNSGGVAFGRVLIMAFSYERDYFCDGSGPFAVDKVFSLGTDLPAAMFSEANNLVPNLSSVQNPLSSWFVQTNGVEIDRVTSPSEADVSISLVAEKGEQTVLFFAPCKPGQGYAAQWYWKATPETSVSVVTGYADSRGNILQATTTKPSQGIAGWSKQRPVISAGGPRGATQVFIRLNVSAGGGRAWIAKPMLVCQ